MSNICDTQYKVRGTRKAMTDLWNTLQELNVNTTNVYLYKLAEHYGISYEQRGISVRGHIYWAEFEDDEDVFSTIQDAINEWCEKTGISQGERTEDEMVDFINGYEYDTEDTYYYIHPFEFD